MIYSRTQAQLAQIHPGSGGYGCSFFSTSLTREKREKILIFGDSNYDQSRSKVVKLLSWVYAHSSGRSLKEFKLMTLGWTDENNFLPLDFIPCSSAKENKRFRELRKNWISAAVATKDGA